MIFEGTKFEKLENSIKNEINRKRRRIISSATTPTADDSNKKRKNISVNEGASVTNKVNNLSKQNTKTIADSVPPSCHDEFINDRTVYIQGLPFTSTEEDISLFFRDVGQIKSIRLPKWHDSGKAKGYCHVEFKSSESALKALELTGEYMQDRTVYLKNLPYDIKEEEISQQFRVYGPIKSIRLAAWNHTGKMKGFGYVEYKREDSAETAVKKSGSISLNGRRVLVDYETGAPKASFKPKKSDAV